MSTSSTEVHVYHISPWRRSMLAWIFGPLLLGALGVWIFVPGAVGGVVMLLVLVIVLPMQWLIERARLEISPAGVRLRQTGYRLETSWSNVVEVRLERGHEAFIAQEPVGGKGLEML